MENHSAGQAPRLLPSIALLSTLSAAFEVHRSVTARRAGLDPSAQEPTPTARTHLQRSAADLRLLLVRLRVSLVGGDEPGTRLRTAARRFPQALMLGQAERSFHRTHQRLLSLYPDVEEDLVETARLLRNRADALPHLDSDAFDAALGTFVEDGFQFLDALQAVY